MTNIFQQLRDARALVADTQRAHAKDWLDSHGYNFSWKDEGGELVLVTPAEHNASVLLRPDEVLGKSEMKELKGYVRSKTSEDAKLRRMRTLKAEV